MSLEIQHDDTLESLARKMLGDGRLTHEIVIPGYTGQGPLPVGKKAFLKDERQGPPSRNWTEPRR